MSYGTRSFPSFGISRSARNNGNNVNYDDPRPMSNVVESTMRIPILDLQQHSQSSHNEVGEIVLNTGDSLLYYNTGRQWIPLAIMDMETRNATELLSNLINLESNRNVVIEAPNSGNIRLVAGNNAPGTGGHVHVSAGQGGFADGEIYLDVGGERSLTIKKTADVTVNNGNLQVDSGDVVVKAGNLELEDPVACINCNIARAEVTVVGVQVTEPQTLLDVGNEEDEEEEDSDVADTVHQDSESTNTETITIPEANLNGMSGILTINLDLSSGNTLSGVVNNSLLQEDSWVGVSTVNSGSGVPHVWLNAPQDGSVRYHIRCLDGELTRVQLHFDVRNSL